MSDITLGTKSYEVTKARLKLWLELGTIHEQITEAVEHKHFAKLAELIVDYVSTAFAISNIDELPWEEVVDAFVKIVNTNALDFEIPLLLIKLKSESTIPWDYPGRNWYFWSSLMARDFGWSLETIAELEVECAVKILQEILVHEQLHKEWEWALSERSISYDSNTKKSKFNPLERPDWMRYMTKPVKKKVVQIPPEMLPIGNVIRAVH